MTYPWFLLIRGFKQVSHYTKKISAKGPALKDPTQAFSCLRDDDTKKTSVIDTQIKRKATLAILRRQGQTISRTSSKPKRPLDIGFPLVILPTVNKENGTYRLYQSFTANQQDIIINRLLDWVFPSQKDQTMSIHWLLDLLPGLVADAAMFANLPPGAGMGSASLNGTVMGKVSCSTGIANLYHRTTRGRRTVRGNTLTILYVFYTVHDIRVARVVGFAQHANGNNVDKTDYNILQWDPNFRLASLGSGITLTANSDKTTSGGGNGLSGHGRYFDGRVHSL